MAFSRSVFVLVGLPAFAAVLSLGSSRATADVVVAPPIEVHTLTHSFQPEFDFFPASSRDSISIGDGGYTGGGAFSVPSISNGDTATMRVQAPAGMKFVIHDPNAFMGLDFFWQAGGDSITLAGGSAVFENLTGVEPSPSYSFLGVGNSGNVIKATLQFDSIGLIEFTALDITIPVQSSPGSGARNFGSVQSNSEPAFYAFAFGPTDHTVMSLEPTAVPEAGAWLLVGVVASAGAAWRVRRRLAPGH